MRVIPLHCSLEGITTVSRPMMIMIKISVLSIMCFFPNDPLWDGQQCDSEGTCCTGANTPPWFSVELPDSTGDDIEVCICQDEGTTNEDSPFQLLELYVQY